MVTFEFAKDESQLGWNFEMTNSRDGTRSFLLFFSLCFCFCSLPCCFFCFGSPLKLLLEWTETTNSSSETIRSTSIRFSMKLVNKNFSSFVSFRFWKSTPTRLSMRCSCSDISFINLVYRKQIEVSYLNPRGNENKISANTSTRCLRYNQIYSHGRYRVANDQKVIDAASRG